MNNEIFLYNIAFISTCVNKCSNSEHDQNIDQKQKKSSCENLKSFRSRQDIELLLTSIHWTAVLQHPLSDYRRLTQELPLHCSTFLTCSRDSKCCAKVRNKTVWDTSINFLNSRKYTDRYCDALTENKHMSYYSILLEFFSFFSVEKMQCTKLPSLM